MLDHCAATPHPAEALRHLLERLTRAPARDCPSRGRSCSVSASKPAPGRPARADAGHLLASAPVSRPACWLFAVTSTLTVAVPSRGPRCEGAALARRPRRRGPAVQLFTDAGISSAVPGSHAARDRRRCGRPRRLRQQGGQRGALRARERQRRAGLRAGRPRETPVCADVRRARALPTARRCRPCEQSQGSRRGRTPSSSGVPLQLLPSLSRMPGRFMLYVQC